jgi:hypothetical protein
MSNGVGMSNREPSCGEAAKRLQAAVARLLVAAEAADRDTWGADIFRVLLSYARAVALDLDADLYRGPTSGQALERLHRLGAELSLHDWAALWPAGEDYSAAVAEAQTAAGEFSRVVRARNAAAAAT